ncbi:hypothetical protein BOX15_Mlig008728g2 [Macrostomum lignano]|uniref:Protein FAM221A n=1 Tax=Macrostomum lignano TaxID=282301 RepID=A0A267E379_9PLAT|nr:hypothetical protein BOX15_Mlig008728g2 [Macrostomum lignano]
MERIQLSSQAQHDVQAYAEYRHIVGDDDGGKMFTPEEYEAYKKRVLPGRIKNRLYVSWTSPSGMDCVLVGPETECFCQHRYKQHKTDFEQLPSSRPIPLPCQVRGCPCPGYCYMPKNGGQPVRCHCKHLGTEHAPTPPYLCKRRECMKCAGYKTSFTCDCGLPAHQHETLVETGEEREARGHPVGQSVPYKAMGGITGFSSLAAGYARLDPSGRGAPSAEFLDQEITGDDNPFLRAHVGGIKEHKMRMGDMQAALKDSEERQSQMRRPGESELDYYERRYQEKQKRAAAARPGPPFPATRPLRKSVSESRWPPSRSRRSDEGA